MLIIDIKESWNDYQMVIELFEMVEKSYMSLIAPAPSTC